MAGVLLAMSPAPLPAVDMGLHPASASVDSPLLEEMFPWLTPLSDAALSPALELIREGKFAEAAALVDAYLGTRPDSAPAHEVKGVLLAMQGNLEEALTALRRSVQSNPSQSTAFTKMGDILLRLERPEEAEAAFRKAVEIEPNDRIAHQRLGLAAAERGDVEAAIDHLQKGIRNTPPEYLGVKINLAALYVRTRQFDAALEVLAPFAGMGDRASLRVLMLAGTASMGKGLAGEAVAYFERAAELEPDNAEPLYARSVALRQQGRLPEALASFAETLARRPDWAEAEYQWAEALRAAEDLPAALEHYDRAAELGAKFPAGMRKAEIHLARQESDVALALYRELRADGNTEWALFERLAGLLQAKGEFAEAEDVLGAAVRLYPQSAVPLIRLGMHHALMRDYVEAGMVLDRARALEPRNPQLLKTASLIAVRRGDLPKAVEEAKTLLEVAPDSTADRFYLGTLLEQLGEASSAAEEYEKVLQAVPAHAGALNNLSLIRFANGDHDRAIDLARQAWELAPESAPILDTYGWMLAQSGDFARARELLAKSVALAPDAPALKYHLAVALKGVGETAEAVAQIEQALAAGQDFQGRAEAEILAATWKASR